MIQCLYEIGDIFVTLLILREFTLGLMPCYWW